MLIQAWPAIREIISAIPSSEELYDLYSRVGAKKTLADIQAPDEALPQLLHYSPSARNRLTLMRTAWMLDIPLTDE